MNNPILLSHSIGPVHYMNERYPDADHYKNFRKYRLPSRNNLVQPHTLQYPLLIVPLTSMLRQR